VKQKPSSPLRNTRRTRTLSQEELARLAGITQESLSKAERGIIQLRPDVQARLAAILGVSRDELFPSEVAAAS
jgi:transcriptional regulator with XRE-family HTH domain